MLHNRGRRDRLRTLGRAPLLELALLYVLVHPLLFVAHARQMLLLWHLMHLLSPRTRGTGGKDDGPPTGARRVECSLGDLHAGRRDDVPRPAEGVDPLARHLARLLVGDEVVERVP